MNETKKILNHFNKYLEILVFIMSMNVKITEENKKKKKSNQTNIANSCEWYSFMCLMMMKK